MLGKVSCGQLHYVIMKSSRTTDNDVIVVIVTATYMYIHTDHDHETDLGGGVGVSSWLLMVGAETLRSPTSRFCMES